MAEIEQSIMDYLGTLTAGAPLAADTPLLESGLLDSINLVQLIQFIEERFGIVLADSDIGPEIFASPQAVAAYVSQRLTHPGLRA
jgi:acyl carrier protein